MKIILALAILISLPSFATDQHYEKNISDGSTIEFKLMRIWKCQVKMLL